MLFVNRSHSRQVSPGTDALVREPAGDQPSRSVRFVYLLRLSHYRREVTRQSPGQADGTNIQEGTMQRITITIDDELMDDVDRLIARRGYQNRSEALRDLARAGIAQDRQRSNQHGDCVAAVVYVYDHAARDLSRRLVKEMHGHHELTLATMHVHLDEKSCLEVNVLKGAINRVEHLADHIIAERGVRHGNLVMIPIDREHPHRRHKGAHQHA
jgi:CopG family nickel-responsive transcriptional regulator